jgi:hypothetical protein
MTKDTIDVDTAIFSSHLLMANMVIFNDPIFIYIGTISGFIGILSVAYDILEKKKKFATFKSSILLLKGLFFGFISAPIMMLVLLIFGEQIFLTMFELKVENQLFLNSLYMLLSLAFSRFIIFKIIDWFEKKDNK